MTGRPISRRRAVISSIRLLTGGIAITLLGCDDDDRAKELILPTGFGEIESMRVVGRKYLQGRPGVTLDALLSELKPGRGWPTLETEIAEQYAKGEVARVDGWDVALTEARVYGVVALGQAQP